MSSVCPATPAQTNHPFSDKSLQQVVKATYYRYCGSMNNITMTDNELLVDGKVVATISDYGVLRDALLDKLTRTEAVYLAVALMGEARTASVAQLLNMDKANATKRLLALEEDGRVEIVDEAHSGGKPGRPSRVWAVS